VIANEGDAIGKILKLDVSAGEPIMPSQLAQGLANYLNPDERAVSIATDELVGVANSVTPGDFVDIFITLDKTAEVMGGQTRLMLSHIRILAYGANTIDGPLTPSNTTNVRNGPPAAIPRTAILAVPLANVNELLLASKAGRLSFALRSPKDNAEPDTTLFASREPVLPGKPGLSIAQKAVLAMPVNAAYAGESLAQFGGAPPPLQTKPLARRQALRSGAGRSIQVIRGNQSETLRY
jgi:pilus assembly protein CpaB